MYLPTTHIPFHLSILTCSIVHLDTVMPDFLHIIQLKLIDY